MFVLEMSDLPCSPLLTLPSPSLTFASAGSGRRRSPARSGPEQWYDPLPNSCFANIILLPPWVARVGELGEWVIHDGSQVSCHAAPPQLLMLTFGITLTPGYALISGFRHKQSTFPLTFSTSPLIYYPVETLR